MAQTKPAPYRVERLSTEAELNELAGPWSDLIAEMPRACVFLTWEWIAAMWQHRAPGWELWALTVTDAAGHLAGVAPLFLDVSGGPVAVRRLSFSASHFLTPIHADFIARPDDAEAVAGAVFDYLEGQRGSWDVLDLYGLSDRSVLNRCLPEMRGRHIAREPLPCPYIPLPPTWDAYEKQLSSNRRQQMRSKSRRLERDFPGQVEFHRVTQADELPEALDRLGELSRQRWKTEGLVSAFTDPIVVAVTHTFGKMALERGWLRLYVLKIKGESVAVELCLRYGEIFANDQRAFDLAWSEHSPGQVLYAYAIRQAIEEGASEFDMLNGTHTYKLSFTDHIRYDMQPFLSASARGDFMLATEALFSRARTTARAVLSKSVRDKGNRMISRLKRR